MRSPLEGVSLVDSQDISAYELISFCTRPSVPDELKQATRVQARSLLHKETYNELIAFIQEVADIGILCQVCYLVSTQRLAIRHSLGRTVLIEGELNVLHVGKVSLAFGIAVVFNLGERRLGTFSPFEPFSSSSLKV